MKLTIAAGVRVLAAIGDVAACVSVCQQVVLILGRFTPERKVVLDAIRDELRKRDYLPVLFDFEKPANKDLTGTISTLANMA